MVHPSELGHIRPCLKRIFANWAGVSQEAIAGIFRKFRELGSIRQVLLWYREEKLPIPMLSRESGNRKVVWTEPVYSRIVGMLKNPAYAGTFV